MDNNKSSRESAAEAQLGDGSWLAEVAQGACRDVGDVPVELLGDYLPLLADAATSGRRPHPAELDAVGLLGRRAAELGVSAGSAVQLYLSAARRLWQQLPTVVRSRDSEVVRAAAAAVLHVVDEAVASLAEGYNDARRQMVRWEETLRREFIEDLLRGDADVGRLVERAEPFGLDMARPHQVALAAPTGRLNDAETSDQPAGTRGRAVGRRPRRPGGDQGRLDRGHHPRRHRRPRAANRAEDARRPRCSPNSSRSSARPTVAGHRRAPLPRVLRHRPVLRGGPRRPGHGRAAAPGQHR